MQLDDLGFRYIQEGYWYYNPDNLQESGWTEYITAVHDAVRVPINVNLITQNMFNALVSNCISVGVEQFKASNLVKYINNQININNITIQDETRLKEIRQYIKSGIAYWFLVTGTTPELFERRKQEIKLYFS